MNRDEALRALHVAQKRLDHADYSGAIRFAKKSIALEATPEAQALLERAERLLSSSASDASSRSAGADTTESTATTSATQSGPSAASTSSRTRPKAATASTSGTNTPPAGGEYTAAQLAVVKRVKSCRVTAYYEILELEKSCSDGQIKKAYRKHALSLHPDKNLAPGAEEAFKMVSKAFQVLSDPNKRSIYDQTGGDPDSRGGGGGGGGFARRSPAGPGFQGGFGGEDVSPEELFRMFFGGQGGGFGGPFGPSAGFGGGPFGGGGTTFQFFGPGGVRMGGGGMPRQAGAGHARGGPQSSTSLWVQMAPLLFLFALSLLTQLPSLFSSADLVDPDFSFDRSTHFSHPRTTTTGVEYFVAPEQFAQHPLYESLVTTNPTLGFTSEHPPQSARYRRDLVKHLKESGATASPVNSASGDTASAADPQPDAPPKLKIPSRVRSFEKNVEQAWVNRLHAYCRHEIGARRDRLDAARGFLGIGRDPQKISQILAEKLPHCEKLSRIPGYSHIQY
ncbi:hypothetical protein JCM10908_002631 [Rhodotorula pacifica]|uniref:J domain-containing protein n=1 Tax=Rhodotorula pacifica TaxID=1495444 RepID=UPI0031722E3C